jgi:hypothetical protein
MAFNRKDYLTIREVADLTNRDVSTIRAWCRADKVKYVRIGGGGGRGPSYFLLRSSLREYLGKDTADVLGI